MAIYVDDRELLAAHRAGDAEAFNELVREHRSSLYRHAYKRLLCSESAEDAVQETLVRAYRALPNFGGEYRLGPWLHRIMQNVCVDEGNRRKRDADKIGRIAALPKSGMESPSIEEELHLDFDESDLLDAMSDLSVPYQEALTMRFVDEMDYHEVASTSGITEENARARVSRARHLMKSALKGAAALPLLLVGLLKRGEKMAAAATSTGGATIAITGTSTVTVSSQAASVGTSSIVEAAHMVAQVAPAAVPAITKAAVGIGIVAAVFAPATDSPVHLAVGDLTSSSVASVQDNPAALDSPVIVVQDLVVDSDKEIPETFAEKSAVEVKTPEVNVPAAVAIEPVEALNLLESNEIIFVSNGPGQYELSGVLNAFSSDDSSIEAVLKVPSHIRVANETSGEARRMDALLVLQSPGGNAFDVRLAGFAAVGVSGWEVSGLFRAGSDVNIQLLEQGSFNGVIQISEDGGLGSASFVFTK